MRRILAALTATVLAAATLGWWVGERAATTVPESSHHTPAHDRAAPPGSTATSAAAPVRADAPWGELTGRVSDLDGHALAGATIVAQDLRGLAGTARSDDEGRWRLALRRWDRLDPPWPDRGWPSSSRPGRTAQIEVAAHAAGRTRSNTRSVTARRGEAVEVGPLALYVGGRIEGRIVDASGNAVPGSVRILGVESKDTVVGMQAVPAPFPHEPLRSTAEDGFRTGPLGPGTVELWAQSPGHGTARGVVVVGEGQTVRVDLPVRVETPIAGRVVDAAGRAVAGCRVLVVPEPERTDGTTPRLRPSKPTDGEAPGDAALPGRPVATDTDAEGRFWFYGLRSGARHTVGVGDTTADGASVDGVLPGTTDVLLVASPRFDLTGVVRDSATGEAIGGAGVLRLAAAQARLLRLTRPLGLADAGRTGPSSGDDGAFRLPGVFAGDHLLLVSRAGYEPAEVAVTVGSVEPASLDVRLVPAAAVTVRVTDGEGRRVAGARIDVTPAPVEGPRSVVHAAWSGRVTGESGDDGACRISGLPADVDLVLRVRAADGASARRPLRLDRSADLSLDVTLRPAATLVVRVHPATDGARAGHPVRLRGLDDPDVRVDVETDADGVAHVTHLPPGRYEVVATDPLEAPSRPDVASRIAVIDLREGAETAHDVSVPDMTELRGTLTDDGAPVRAGRVGFGPLPGTPDHFRPLLFEARDGAWSGRVPPGRYHVHIAYPGRRHEFDDPVVVPAAPTFTLDLAFPER